MMVIILLAENAGRKEVRLHDYLISFCLLNPNFMLI